MRRWIVALTALCALWPSAAFAVPPVVVVDEPRVGESEPSRSAGYLVYSVLRNRGANTVVVPDGGARIRVNREGTDSASSSIDGTTVAHDEFRGDDSDIRFFDVVTQTRSRPDGVNTPNWESDPSLAGDWLLYFKTNANRVDLRRAYARLILLNMQTDERRVLLDVPHRSWFIETDQVHGDWATYETCRFRNDAFSDCQVFRHRISMAATRQIPNPGLQQAAAAVTDDGTVYFARSGGTDRWRCGSEAKIMRKPMGGPAVAISQLPDGIDVINGMFAFEEGDGSVTLYLTRYDCERNTAGVYRIPNADTATA